MAIDFDRLDQDVLDNYTWEEFFLINCIPYAEDGTHEGKPQYRVVADDFPEFVGINGTNTGTGSKKRLSFRDSTKKGVDWADSEPTKSGKKRSFNIIQAHALRNGISQGKASIELAKEKGLPIPEDGKASQKTNSLFEYHTTNDIKALKKPENKDIQEHLLKRKLIKIDSDSGKLITGDIGYNEFFKRIAFFNRDKAENIVYASYREIPEEIFTKKYPGEDFEEYSKYGKYTHPSEKTYEKELELLNKEVPFNYYYSCKYSNSNEIYITEGIPDSQSLLINGKNNLCMGSVSVSGTIWNKYFLPVLENYRDKTIVFLGDNDDAGRKAVVKWIKTYLIPNGYTNFYVEVIPRTDAELLSDNPYSSHFLTDTEVKTLYPNKDERYKDVNEVCEKREDAISELEKTRIHGFSYLAMVFKEEYDDGAFIKFKHEIIRPHYTNMKKYELDVIISDLEKYKTFEEEEINQLKDYIEHAPSQNEVVENIKEKYHIMYDPNGKLWYKFNGKVWDKVYSDNIDTLIQQEYGSRFKDGAKLDTVRKLLRSNEGIINNNIVFNQSDALVFNNGTLYLKDTREATHFEENKFNPSDKVNVIFEFDYNPSAFHENWSKFLQKTLEVRDANKVRDEKDTQTKIKMLQDFTGYILFHDCHLERFVIFLGNGGNGKNVFFETIGRILPHELVGYKPVTQFKERHSMSFFKDKILNISGEAKGSLYGNETMIKDLVSGSDVTDDPKYRDEITFRNRAKLIICGNEDFKIEDKSRGFTRRILFIDFANIYTDEEEYLNRDNPKYQEIDVDLKERLLKEDAGIFNWILDGYFRLKENNKFIESKEHKRILERFKRSNNLVRDYILNEKVFSYDTGKNCYTGHLDTMFYNYQISCKEFNNTQPGNRDTFSKNLRNTLDDLGIEYEAKRARSTMESDKFTTIFTLENEYYDRLMEIAEAEY